MSLPCGGGRHWEPPASVSSSRNALLRGFRQSSVFLFFRSPCLNQRESFLDRSGHTHRVGFLSSLQPPVGQKLVTEPVREGHTQRQIRTLPASLPLPHLGNDSKGNNLSHLAFSHFMLGVTDSLKIISINILIARKKLTPRVLK